MTKLLITGATGLVGALALNLALSDQRVTRVIALTRRPIPTREKLENIVIDFADMPADAAWWKVDGVIGALGTTRKATKSQAAYREIDRDYPLSVAIHARNHGATRFALTSSLGANANSRFNYPRIKGELERELQNLGYPSLTIIRPSVLGGDRTQTRPEERMATILVKLLAPVLPARLRLSPASIVAAALLEAAIAAPPGVHFKTNENMT